MKIFMFIGILIIIILIILIIFIILRKSKNQNNNKSTSNIIPQVVIDWTNEQLTALNQTLLSYSTDPQMINCMRAYIVGKYTSSMYDHAVATLPNLFEDIQNYCNEAEIPIIPCTSEQSTVTVYNIMGIVLTTQNVYNGPGCNNPVEVKSIIPVGSTMTIIPNLPTFNNDVNSFIYLYIALLGDMKMGFLEPDQYGIFPSNSFVNSNFNVTVISVNPSAIRISPIIDTKTNPLGSIPKFSLYVYDNMTGIIQIFNISRSINYIGPQVSTTRPFSVFPAVIQYSNNSDGDKKNYLSVNSDSLKNFTPQYIYIGPTIPLVPNILTSTPPPSTTSCISDCPPINCGGLDGCGKYCPITPFSTSGIKWTYINGCATFMNLESQTSADGGSLYTAGPLAPYEAPCGVAIGIYLKPSIIFSNMRGVGPNSPSDYTGLPLITPSMSTQVSFIFDESINAYISTTAGAMMLFPSTCNGFFPKTDKLDSSLYCSNGESSNVYIRTVSTTDPIGVSTNFPIYRSPWTSNPTPLASSMNQFTFTPRSILSSVNYSLSNYRSDAKNLIYIELIGPLECGFEIPIKGEFAPLQDQPNFKVITLWTNKVFFIYSNSDIQEFNLYVYNYSTGITQILTISRIGGNVEIVSLTNSITQSANICSNSASGLGSNLVTANAKFIYIGPEIFTRYNPEDDPKNIVTIYDRVNFTSNFHGSIYQAILCYGNPKQLSTIMNTQSTIIPQDEKTLFGPGFYDYTCVFIGLVGGNLSLGFNEPDLNGIWDKNRYINPNLQIVQQDTTVVIKSITGTISNVTVYVFDNVSGILQTFVINRTTTTTTANSASIISFFSDIENIFQIDSPLSGMLTPQYIYIGPPILDFTSNYNSITRMVCPFPPLEIPTIPPISLDIPTGECVAKPNILPNPKRQLKDTTINPYQKQDPMVPISDYNYLEPSTFLSKLDVDEFIEVVTFEGPCQQQTTENYSHNIKFGAQAPSYITDVLNSYLPPSFSWPFEHPMQIELPRSQGQCGSCWVVTVASCLGDKFALQHGIVSPYPSALWISSMCGENLFQKFCIGNNACLGGYPNNSIQFCEENYTKLESCWPYDILLAPPFIGPQVTLSPGGTFVNYLESIPKPIDYLGGIYIPDNVCYQCNATSAQGFTGTIPFSVAEDRASVHLSVAPNSFKTFRASNNRWIDYTPSDVIMYRKMIQYEIMCSGPVIGTFIWTNDFSFFYRNLYNIWKNNTNIPFFVFVPTFPVPASETNFHAISITGWGNYFGIDFWQIRNSHGCDTPYDGYLYIAMTNPYNLQACIGLDLPNNHDMAGTVYSFRAKTMDNIQLNKLISDGIFTSVI